MDMKRFVGKDMSSALRRVSQELGPDAMVLRNTRIEGGVEVIAAAPGSERTEPLTLSPQQSAASRLSEAPPAGSPAEQSPRPGVRIHGKPGADSPIRLLEENSAARPVSASGPEMYTEDGMKAMQRELQTLRHLLERELSSGNSLLASGKPIRKRLQQQLVGMGFSNRFASELCLAPAALADESDVWREIITSVRERIEVTGDMVEKGGRFALVGPTGAGKTTTLCKLAIRYALAHGADSLALVNLDQFRIGAGETLRSVGRMLEVPVHEARDTTEFNKVLTQLEDKKLVLIDTAGLNRREGARTRQLDALTQHSATIKSLLTVPVTSQASCMQSFVKEYRIVSPAALVLTRLDEAVTLGESLELSVTQRLKLAYTSDGPEIPDDLELAEAQELMHVLELLGRKRAANESVQSDENDALAASITSYNSSVGLSTGVA